MSKNFSKYFLLLGLIGFQFFSAGALCAADQAPGQSVGWQKRMKDLYTVLAELLPDVVSEERFNSPKHAHDIEMNARKLAQLSHGFNHGGLTSDQQEFQESQKFNGAKHQKDVASPDFDLSVSMIGSLFETETSRAYQELKRGRRAYARSILRTVPGFCIGCHTRNSAGSDLSRISALPPTKTFSTQLERAEFFAATRQFDQALNAFEEIVSNPKSAEGRQLEWERAVRYSLVVAVRVKRDAPRALALVDKIVASPMSPRFLKEDALQWKSSIKQWQEELGRQPQSEEGVYAEAVRLMALAHTQQKYPADRSADILYLRASAVTHELLARYPKGPHVAEGLMLLGVSYEALRDLDLWSLHEMYFIACIQKAPHTAIAESCYQRFEETTYAGFSGSGGIALPEDIKRQLTELKSLAQPEAKKAP